MWNVLKVPRRWWTTWNQFTKKAPPGSAPYSSATASTFMQRDLSLSWCSQKKTSIAFSHVLVSYYSRSKLLMFQTISRAHLQQPRNCPWLLNLKNDACDFCLMLSVSTTLSDILSSSVNIRTAISQSFAPESGLRRRGYLRIIRPQLVTNFGFDMPVLFQFSLKLFLNLLSWFYRK